MDLTADILAIHQLHARYCQLIDDLRFDDLGKLFLDDAVWEAGPLRFEGRPAIVAGFAQIEPPRPGMVRHISFNPVIDFAGDEAHVWADAIALQVGAPGESSPVVAVGRYFDVLKRDGGHWRFARRTFAYSGQPLPEGVQTAPSPP